MVVFKPGFPTKLHQGAANIVGEYFSKLPVVDTVLVVNSCARGQAVPESDLDFAILVKPGTTACERADIEAGWITYSHADSTIAEYRKQSKFCHLHLDIIDGNYNLPVFEEGVAADSFEIEIGNQVCYAAPLYHAGPFFTELRNKWLPYYHEELRLQRLAIVKEACEYDLDHIPFFVKRGLHFQAFDILCKAFQKYLQALFIVNKTYPIAYNKWIKEQVANWLNKPALYAKLPPVLSVCNIESDEINGKVKMLKDLLYDLNNK